MKHKARTPAVRRPARRRRLGIALAAGVAAAVIAAAAWRWLPGAPPAAPGPIVLISIDTLRADRLPAYGYTGTSTPHLDRLAADAVLFESAWSHSPQTLPAHASMLTGLLPFEHGVRDNIGFTVRPGQRMLQHALAERGYSTAAFVSSYVLRSQTGLAQGFDVYDDLLPRAGPDTPLGMLQRPGGQTFEAAAAWIDRQDSPRFFLFGHVYEPHAPYTPPARFAGADPYDGEVAHADEIVGGLLDHLRARGLYDGATIVLVSDHGEGLGDHGEDEHGIFLYRSTIQVPLFVKLPGSRGAGRRVASPVQQIDLLPTLLDLTGGGSAGMRGRSLRPVLEGGGALPETGLYAESLSPRYHFGWSELYALTDGRYRFIRAPRDELYDLAQDPRERASIAAERSQVRDAMRAALDRLIGDGPVDAPAAVTDEDRQRLAALGYVGTQRTAALQLPGDQLPDPKDKVDVLRTYRRATTLAGSGRLAEAMELFRALVRDDPEMTDVWLRMAEAHNQLGRPAEALAAYREVITRNPQDAAALTGAAGALLRLGRIAEARDHARLAAGVAPAQAHEMLARIAAERGEEEVARREARLAQEADPALPMSAFIEGVLRHRQGQHSAAVPHLMEAAAAQRGRTEQVPDTHYLLGDSLARLERYDEAERHFLAELEVFPRHVRARAGLAMLYRAMGRDAESDRAVEQLIEQAPGPEGLAMAAQLWTMFGQPERAARTGEPRGPGSQ